MLSRAHALIDNYKENGISSDRILVRLPGTWQGIQAAKKLESEGISAHLTLIYRSECDTKLTNFQHSAAAIQSCNIVVPIAQRQALLYCQGKGL